MQLYNSIAESSYRSFLQNNQAALGKYMSKTPIYVYQFYFIFQFTLILLYICVGFFFQDKIPENLKGS